MRRFLLIALLVFTLTLIPTMASAQGPVVVDEFYAQFWPEYDRSEMLVIYNIALAEDVELPATFSIRIPAAAGEPYAVAVGGVGDTTYQREVAGDWAWITIEVPLEPTIIIEYYDPALIIDGRNRTYQYNWPGDVQVNNFYAAVQQPFDASSMQLSEPAVVGTDSQGLMVHQINLGAVPAGEQFELSVTYQKASDTLYEEMINSAPPTDASTLPEWVPYLAVGGILVVAVVLYWNSTQRSPSKRGRSPASQRRSSRPASSPKAVLFCHECGTQAVEGDKFCRECGTKLRV